MRRAPAADEEAALGSPKTPQRIDDAPSAPRPGAGLTGGAAQAAGDAVSLEELLLDESAAPGAGLAPAPARPPGRDAARLGPASRVTADPGESPAGALPTRRRPGWSRVALVAAAGAGVLLLLAGGAVVLLRRPPAPEGPAHLEGIPPVTPVDGTGAAPVAPRASPAAAPATPASATASAAARPAGAASPAVREEPLYAGRPLAWWNERVRSLGGMGGEEALRLRALTLRRAAGLGLRVRGDVGTTLEPATEAP